MTDVLERIPDVIKALGGVSGISAMLYGYFKWKKSQETTKNELIQKYKKLYIKQSEELLEVYEGSAKQKRVLVEMEVECPSCYDAVMLKLGYDKDEK